MASLERTVDEALERLAVDRSAPAVVACSGGPDSLTLAHIAMGLSAQARLGPVILAYIDHGLRPNSSADGEMIREFSRSGGGSYDSRLVEVPRDQGSLEAAAREVRYRALHEIAEAQGAKAILVGHTARDQVETVFMRMLRGTGVAGLAGIPERNQMVVRPMLGADYQAICDYVREHQLSPLEDAMNQDERHFRVRVRNHWLPSLRQENPQIDRALLALNHSAAQQRQVLDWVADVLLAQATRASQVPGEICLAVEPLRRAPVPGFVHLLSVLCRDLGVPAPEAKHMGELSELVRGPAAGTRSTHLPGLKVVREYELLRLSPTIDGAGQGPEMTVKIAGARPDLYEIRVWQPGDRMRPDRLRGRSKKLSDLFGDGRIPRRLREAARVVVRLSDREIVWAEHIGPAYEAEVDVTLTPPRPVATNR